MAEEASGDWGPLSALPGNPLIWVLIASELAVFGGALLGFSGARLRHAAAFAADQDKLDRLAGALNTAALLTSGLCAALAAVAREAGRRVLARLALAGAGALGLVFLAVKAAEYQREWALGADLDSSPFFTLYFLTTGFHAAHVVLGLLILGLVARFDSVENYRTGTAFWHMVDLVWIVIFPCFYLLR